MRLAFSIFSALSQSFSALAHWLHPRRGELSGSVAAPSARTARAYSHGLSPGTVSGIAAQSKPPLRHLANTGISVPRTHATHRVQSATLGTFGPDASSHRNARCPVRVLHPATRPEVGRMAIAGRMADVCAELERMAACESWQH